jgi:hypothetical protein
MKVLCEIDDSKAQQVCEIFARMRQGKSISQEEGNIIYDIYSENTFIDKLIARRSEIQ